MLHNAACHGQLLILKTLSAWGAALEQNNQPGLDVDAKDHVERTPLHAVCLVLDGSLDAAERLIRMGCTINSQDMVSSIILECHPQRNPLAGGPNPVALGS